MSNDISVGDLVMVVQSKACCGGVTAMGMVFQVESYAAGSNCVECGAVRVEDTACVTYRGIRWGLAHYRLKKLNPPATGSEAQTSRERHEPKRSPVKA